MRDPIHPHPLTIEQIRQARASFLRRQELRTEAGHAFTPQQTEESWLAFLAGYVAATKPPETIPPAPTIAHHPPHVTHPDPPDLQRRRLEELDRAAGAVNRAPDNTKTPPPQVGPS